MSDPVQCVVTERVGAVAHVRMNRPDALNVLDRALADGLVTALASVSEDSSVRAVVLTGAGRSFMAGGDLAEFRADLDGAPQTAEWLIARFHTALRCIKAMPKPVIAAIQGPVAGGGLGLALSCDLVVAAENLSLLSAFTRLGTSPDSGTTWSLTRLLGPRRALAMMLLNDPVDARTALELGLVNAVVPEERLVDEALALGARLAGGARHAGAAVKRLVQSASTCGFDAQLDLEKAAFTQAAGTADFREGITAFFARRPPVFED